VTPPGIPDATAPGGPPRRRRLNRSRAIAAGTSVGALVVLTAGVAVANPGTHSSPPASTASTSGRVQTPDAGSDAGDDTGWLAPDDPRASDGGAVDPNSGWNAPQPDPGSGTFDPGFGGGDGNTRSGGS
jgi:hypothetical protein